MAPAQTSRIVPSLFALLPHSQLTLMLARLSLMAIHVESCMTQDDMYVATHGVVPNDAQNLRLRGRRRRPGSTTATGRWSAGMDGDEDGTDWEYSLAWVSKPFSGREHASMRVQAQVELDVAGLSSRREIEDFIVAMGHKHLHGYTRVGHMFHLPIAGRSDWTLHLTITKVLAGEEKAQDTSEPYLVQLSPARAINALPVVGEPSLRDMMVIIQGTAEKIEGLTWESGR